MTTVYLAKESMNVIPPKFFDFKIDAYNYLNDELEIWNGDHPGMDDIEPTKSVTEMTVAEALNLMMSWRK